DPRLQSPERVGFARGRVLPRAITRALIAEPPIPAGSPLHGGRRVRLRPRVTALLLVGAMQFYFLVYPLSSKLVGPESAAIKAEIKRQLIASFLGGAPKSAKRRTTRSRS